MKRLLHDQLDSLLRQYSLPDLLFHLSRVLADRRNRTVQAGAHPVCGRGAEARALKPDDCELIVQELLDLHNLVVERQYVPTAEAVLTYRVDLGVTGLAIVCLRCGTTSYNSNDILMKYCGACDWMHEQRRPRNLQDVDKYNLQDVDNLQARLHDYL